MLNVTAAMQHLNIPSNSIAGAVRAVAEKFEDTTKDANALATKLIKDIIGVDITFEDANQARLTAMAVAEAAVKAKGVFEDENEALKVASERVTKHLADPANVWMYTKSARTEANEAKTEVVAGLTPVAVKANGKIKKGGKQILAAELYTKHVLQATPAATNQEFIKILVKALGMSPAGATTYAYNCKKQLGEPEGGIVKAKKGRKAK